MEKLTILMALLVFLGCAAQNQNRPILLPEIESISESNENKFSSIKERARVRKLLQDRRLIPYDGIHKHH